MASLATDASQEGHPAAICSPSRLFGTGLGTSSAGGRSFFFSGTSSGGAGAGALGLILAGRHLGQDGLLLGGRLRPWQCDSINRRWRCCDTGCRLWSCIGACGGSPMAMRASAIAGGFSGRTLALLNLRSRRYAPHSTKTALGAALHGRRAARERACRLSAMTRQPVSSAPSTGASQERPRPCWKWRVA